MKIGIDLRALEGGIQHRGIGRYATQLIEALSEIDKNNEYIFFISDPSVEAPTFKLSQGFSSSIKTGKKAWTRKAKFVRTMYLRQNPLHVDRYDLDVFFSYRHSATYYCKKNTGGFCTIRPHTVYI